MGFYILRRIGMGLGGVAMASLLQQELRGAFAQIEIDQAAVAPDAVLHVHHRVAGAQLFLHVGVDHAGRQRHHTRALRVLCFFQRHTLAELVHAGLGRAVGRRAGRGDQHRSEGRLDPVGDLDDPRPASGTAPTTPASGRCFQKPSRRPSVLMSSIITTNRNSTITAPT